MNEKEKKEFYIAMCKCCLIAQAMKTCRRCLFNVGLAEGVKPADPLPSGISIEVGGYVMAEAA